MKNLEIIERERLVERAEKMGQRMLDGLMTLGKFEMVGEVRGLGLMAAVALVAVRATKAPFAPKLKVGEGVRKGMQDRGVFTRARNDVILLAPPLVIREDQIDRIVSSMMSSIQEVQGRLSGAVARK